jgi:hypothetical protein
MNTDTVCKSRTVFTFEERIHIVESLEGFERMPHRHIAYLSLLALVFGVAGFFVHQADYPLTYDEGDYYFAVQKGFWANWTDHDDIPVADFISMGVSALRDAESRARLSDQIRASETTIFYRHYHPPLAFYPAIALSPFTGALALHWQLRLANLFWLLFWILCITVIAWKYDYARSPMLLLLPASAAYAMAVVGYNMHLPFGMMLTLFLYCLYLYELGGDTTLLRAAEFFFVATLLSVAYGMFIVFLVVLVLVWRLYRSGAKARFLRRLMRSTAWVALFILILWPAAFINLSLIKNWVFVMYIAVFRLSAETAVYGDVLALLFGKWNASPLELLLVPVVLISIAARIRRLSGHASVFIATGLVLILLYLQVNPTLVYRWYLFPAFAVMLFFLTEVITREYGLHFLRRPVVVAAMSAVMFTIAVSAVQKPDYSELITLHEMVKMQSPAAMTLPRSVEPQLRPYYPDTDIVSIHDTAFDSLAVADSLDHWRRRGLVILPRDVAPVERAPDAGTERYVLYWQARQETEAADGL